jgi:trigger factor
MLIEGCKHAIDITVPVEEVDRETEKAVTALQKRVKLPGFRPGKVPANIIRARFAHQLRDDVLESVIPTHLQKRFEQEDLKVVGRPTISDVQFKSGEPLTFKAEFEVAPEIELGEYRGVTVHYTEPEVSDSDVDARINQLREQKAQYVNLDPRPVEDGDYVLVTLDSIGGVDQPMHEEEVSLHVNDPDTMPEFTENLRGMSPGEEKEFDVTYPEDFGQAKLAGKTVRFRMQLNTIRRKELPELNDEFAKDLGDFNSLEELREAVRKSIFREREFEAQRKAKDELVDRLVESHEFPVPETFLDRQIENETESRLREMAGYGVDVSKLKLDWTKVKETQRPKAVHDVKAALLLDKIAEREAIYATQDEVDREVQAIARQEREPVAAMRKKLEKNGAMGRIANHIRTEKTLNLLFEHARKVAGEREEKQETSAEAE